MLRPYLFSPFEKNSFDSMDDYPNANVDVKEKISEPEAIRPRRGPGIQRGGRL